MIQNILTHNYFPHDVENFLYSTIFKFKKIIIKSLNFFYG
jgi:hypothetical protein